MNKDNFNMPLIGFGTWKLPNSEETIEIVKNAIDSGYRLIDTAKAYGNENYIGRGIKASSIKREELFITGKLWNSDRDNVEEACLSTISKLECDYLDLYLMHWPASKAVHEDWILINKRVWEQLEKLYDKGLVKAIGVCNFNKLQLEELLKTARIKPFVNQIEFHPGFRQEETLDFCLKNNILVEAWSPLGSGKLLKKKLLQDMALKYNKTPADICIAFSIQNNVIPIVKTRNKDRMISNLKAVEFKLSSEDLNNLNNLPYIGGSGLDSFTITIFD